MHDAQPRDGDREAKIRQWETYDLAREVLQHYLKVYVFASDWGDACFVRIDFQTLALPKRARRPMMLLNSCLVGFAKRIASSA